MNPLLVAPLGLALAGLAASWFLPRFVHPALCARLLVGAIAAAAAATVSALVLVALAAVGEIPVAARWVGWCKVVYPDSHGASLVAGATAVAALTVALIQGVRFWRRFRAEVAPWVSAAPLEIVAADQPTAFAVPGDPGSIVVSTSLLTALDEEERSAVLAHERAHLEHRHHRYVRTAGLCAAAFPFLAPLSWRVRFVTERWADERAADDVGSRDVVARAIARVGLFTHDAGAMSLGFTGRGTAARVKALMDDPPHQGTLTPIAASVATVGGVFAASSVQLHHLAALVAHLCGA